MLIALTTSFFLYQNHPVNELEALWHEHQERKMDCYSLYQNRSTILSFHFCRKAYCLKMFKQFLKLYDSQFLFLSLTNAEMKENRKYPENKCSSSRIFKTLKYKKSYYNLGSKKRKINPKNGSTSNFCNKNLTSCSSHHHEKPLKLQKNIHLGSNSG